MIATGVAARRLDLRAPFLEGLAPQDLNSIVRAATQQRFPAKTVVYRQGDAARHLFLLIDGRARFFYVTSEGQKILGLWLPPGEIFGAMALMSKPSRYQVSAETVKDSSVFVWERTILRGLVARYPRLLENALSTASEYLAWAIAAHVGLACHSAPQRLAQALVSLVAGMGRDTPDGVELDVTNEELANMANITVFTTSRLLRKWQRHGAVVRSRGKIMLRAPEQLLSHEV